MSLNFVSSSVLSSTDGVSHNTETPIENRGASNNHYNSLSHRSSGQTPLFEQLRKNQQEAQDNYDEVTKAMRGTRTLDDEDVAHLQSVENVRVDRDREVQRNIDQELQMFRAAKMEKEMTVTVAAHPDDDNDDDDNDENANASANANANGSQGQGLLEHTRIAVSLNDKNTSSRTSSAASIWPKIVVTKKRRRQVPHSLTNAKQGGNFTKKIATIGTADGDSTLHSTSIRTKIDVGTSIGMNMGMTKNQEETSHTTNNNNNNSVLPTDDKTNEKEVFGGLLGDYGSDDDSD